MFRIFSFGIRICVAGCVVMLASATTAAPPKPAAPAKAPAPEVEIPHSVFTNPANPKEGKDPFFPTSTRPFASKVTAAPHPTVDASSLILNGLIPRVSVMINGHTLYKGDEAEVKDSSGAKIRVKCLEVREDSAVIEAGGERRELHLRQGVF